MCHFLNRSLSEALPPCPGILDRGLSETLPSWARTSRRDFPHLPNPHLSRPLQAHLLISTTSSSHPPILISISRETNHI